MAQAASGASSLLAPSVSVPSLAAAKAAQAATAKRAAAKPAPKVAAKPVAARPAPKPKTTARRAGPSFLLMGTGYTSLRGQTDATPFITATGAHTRFGIIAVSRNLLGRLPYGSLVRIEDLTGRGSFNEMLRGTQFVIEDTMHPRKYNQIDIWFPARSQALRWGIRTVRVTLLRYGRA